MNQLIAIFLNIQTKILQTVYPTSEIEYKMSDSFNVANCIQYLVRALPKTKKTVFLFFPA